MKLFVCAAFVFFHFLMGCNPNQLFNHEYYNHVHNPKFLTQYEVVNALPDSFKIKGLQNFDAPTHLGPPSLLRMLNQGQYASHIEAYNWAMGYTYGATYKGQLETFAFHDDIQTGFDQSEKTLGLFTEYVVMDDSLIFLKKLKIELLQKQFVVLQLSNKAADSSQPNTYCGLVVTGYNPKGVWYLNPYKQQEQYLLLPYTTLWKAISVFTRTQHYPWRFNITSFRTEQAFGLVPELLIQNAARLKGKNFHPFVSTGAKAIEQLAKDVNSMPLTASTLATLRHLASLGFETRTAMHRYLYSTYQSNEQVLKAASHLQEAANSYHNLLNAIDQAHYQNGELSKYLHIAGQHEQSTSDLLVVAAKSAQN